jgi:hypothetical protein
MWRHIFKILEHALAADSPPGAAHVPWCDGGAVPGGEQQPVGAGILRCVHQLFENHASEPGHREGAAAAGRFWFRLPIGGAVVRCHDGAFDGDQPGGARDDRRGDVPFSEGEGFTDSEATAKHDAEQLAEAGDGAWSAPSRFVSVRIDGAEHPVDFAECENADWAGFVWDRDGFAHEVDGGSTVRGGEAQHAGECEAGTFRLRWCRFDGVDKERVHCADT